MSDFDAAYFEENYADYSAQNPPGKLGHYHAAIRRRVEADRALSVLDVGCGLGVWADHLARAEPGWAVSASDVDAGVIASNQARFPTVDFSVARAGEDAPQSRFDVLTAMDVLEHVPNIENQFSQLCSWLVPGGLFAFVVPVYDGPLGPIVHLLDKDPTHIHKWSRKRWLELAEGQLVDVEWHGLFRIMPPVGRYIHFPSSRLRQAAPAVFVSGRTRSSADQQGHVT